MDQDPLFHERIEDAVLAVVDRCGGRKKFAVEMWPDKSPIDAHNLLNACINPEKRERFSPDQLLYIAKRGRAVGCHAVMTFMAHEVGYSDPKPIDPEDERAALQRLFIEHSKAMQRVFAQMEKITTTTSAPLRSVG